MYNVFGQALNTKNEQEKNVPSHTLVWTCLNKKRKKKKNYYNNRKGENIILYIYKLCVEKVRIKYTYTLTQHCCLHERLR